MPLKNNENVYWPNMLDKVEHVYVALGEKDGKEGLMSIVDSEGKKPDFYLIGASEDDLKSLIGCILMNSKEKGTSDFKIKLVKFSKREDIDIRETVLLKAEEERRKKQELDKNES